MSHDDVAERRAWVKSYADHLSSLTPPIRATPAKLFRRASVVSLGTSLQWFGSQNRAYMLGRFKDDLRFLQTVEREAAPPGATPDSGAPRSPLHRRNSRNDGMVRAHSIELVEKVFSKPEVLLGADSAFDRGETAQIDYAKQHLGLNASIDGAARSENGGPRDKGTYPDIVSAWENLRKKEQERDALAGKPAPIWLAGTGTFPTGGSARELLYKKVRSVTTKLYPGFPEYNRSGNPEPRSILIGEIVEDVWAEIELVQKYPPRGYELVLEPVGDHWRVCRPHGTGFAMVPSKDLGKARELGKELQRLANDRELHRSYGAVQGTRQAANVARDSFLEKVRRLGTQLRHGALILGSCDLDY